MLAVILLKKNKKCGKMFDRRLNMAKALEQTMKIHKIVKVSNFKQEFDVLSTNTSRVAYNVIICNVPLCTCPDYKKNGMLVSCKHIIFILLLVLKLDEKVVRNARHIGDEDVKAFFNNVQLEERFMKQAPLTKRINVRELLEQHELFGQQQTYTLHHKVKRNAKCTGCKNVLQVATLTVRVDGALTVPYGRNKAVKQIFYFCEQKSCFTKVPIWCNFKMPVELSCHEDVSQDEVNQL